MAKKVIEETGEIVPVIATWRNPRKVVGLKCDESIIQKYDFAYDADKRDMTVVEAGKEDREAYIQSFAKDTGVYNILKKYSKTGDISLINVTEGVYADISDIPADELDPAAVAQEAAKAVAGLNSSLGVNLSAEELSKMSAEQLNELINKAVAAQASKVSAAEGKKEGE